ncbi:MAG: methyltransferase domain-containing protein [Acidimicrobiia bacterium]
MAAPDPADTARTWPFWAPSQAEAVEAALDLADVGPGVRLLDLGCGDGQVLLAAARRGAAVAGVEADADLAAEAAEHLAEAGVEADVREGDLFDPAVDIAADVLFSYLAPATLQRLLPRIAETGAALVTVDFDVPGLVPAKRSGAARLYRLPGRRRALREPGWPSAGTLVATVPDVQSLSCLEATHPGGPTRVRADVGLASVASLLSGADRLDQPGALAVDLRWEGAPAGTFAGGAIRVEGLDDHHVFVLHTDEEESVWELSVDGVAGLRRALLASHRPTTVAEALAAAES